MKKDQNYKIYTRTCVDCGRVMEQVGPTCKRCPACAAKHSNLLQNRQRAAYAQRETCRRREAQTAESRRQLHADARAARQAGRAPKGDGFDAYHPDDITKSEVLQ